MFGEASGFLALLKVHERYVLSPTFPRRMFPGILFNCGGFTAHSTEIARNPTYMLKVSEVTFGITLSP